MTILRSGFGDAGGYEIEKSLRSKGASLNRISRQFTVAPTDPKKGTLSLWFKRSKLGAVQYLLGATNAEFIEFQASDKLRISNISGSPYWITTRVFRDPSAWMNLTIAWDSTQAIASNRGRVWVNGAEITAWDSKPDITQNSEFYGWAKNLGGIPSTLFGSAYFDQNFDGYGAEVYWVDGQFLTPDNFGEFNSNGVWVPKKYTGTYGNNGFYLDFKDGTSLTTLGHDKSGNNNHWTLNGYSLTAGATYDWMDDTPTNNFATLNPLDNANTLSNGNLTATFVSHNSTRSTFFINSGKWYVEAFCTGQTTIGGSVGHFGLVRRGQSLIGTMTSGMPNNFYGWWTGTTSYPGAIQFGSGSSGNSNAYNVADNDILGILINFDANEIKYYKNNSLVYTSTAPSSDDWSISVGLYAGVVYNVNFGQRPFVYPPPAGFKSLCTKNRPSVTIPDPRQHHTVITVTKSGDTNFTLPWNATDFDTLFWIKRRDASGDWYQIDGLRGYDKILRSNSTAAETTDANVLGVSGTTCTLKSTLPNGTYVIYAWKAGRVAERQTNTDGLITSTVSRNVTAGFSIVTYTGTGANATVGHGLGNAPKMYSVRARNYGGAVDWPVYHSGLTSALYAVFLNSTGAQSGFNTYWNSTAPTSAVFSIGGTDSTSSNGTAFVAYCHAEIPGYSKFGSYTANGSTDGPFVWGDVSVMDVLVKRSDRTEHWQVYDTARDASNVASAQLRPNLSSSEASGGTYLDYLSNGFKLRNVANGGNVNGGTYIYAAYAKHPFGAENVSPAPAR